MLLLFILSKMAKESSLLNRKIENTQFKEMFWMIQQRQQITRTISQKKKKNLSQKTQYMHTQSIRLYFCDHGNRFHKKYQTLWQQNVWDNNLQKFLLIFTHTNRKFCSVIFPSKLENYKLNREWCLHFIFKTLIDL